MSEQWMGLHHPDWHDSVGVRAWCRCGTYCSDGAACDCCELVELRAEVETLRAQVQAVRDVLGDVSNVYAPSGVSPLVDVSLILEALDGAQVSERLMSRAEVESVTYKALIYALAEVAALRWQVRQDHCPFCFGSCACDGEGN